MKRIIICCDGTWNKPGQKDKGKIVHTNVEKLYRALEEKNEANGIKQVKFYDRGVGTGFSLADKLLGGITGAGIDKNIQDAYKFIICNYSIGDEIYLFGFSRGAYTARSLAGFIRTCGILKPENLHLVAEAYRLYRDRNEFSQPDSDLMKGFKQQFCFEPITRIRCLGVWDTVGALGIPLRFYQLSNKAHYQFHDVVLSSTVDYAYHALALNERRFLFKPTLWKKSKNATEGRSTINMEQRWFIGSHSNVGGGYADSGLSDISLIWMMKKVEDLGLGFNATYIEHNINPNSFGKIRNSRTLLYQFTKARDRFIKIGASYNETIDPSVIERMNHAKNYKPRNVIAFLKHRH